MIAFYITPDLFGNGSVPIMYFLVFLDLLVYWLLLGKVPLDPFGDTRRHHLWLEAEKSKILRAKKKREEQFAERTKQTKKKENKGWFSFGSSKKKYQTT